MSCHNMNMVENIREKVANEIAIKHDNILVISYTTKICPNLDCESHINNDYKFLLLSTYYLKICAYCDTHLFWDLEKGQKGL